MRKITLLFAFLVAFTSSCLNEGESPKESIFKADILDYLNHLKSINHDEGQKIEELISVIDFKAIEEYGTIGSERVLIADIKTFDALDKSDKVLALFFVSENKIVRSRLVAFVNEQQFREYSKLLLSIIRMDGNKLNYSGTISFYNSMQMLLMQNVIENGELKSHGLVRKDDSQSGPTGRTNTCTEWFLVTTYYYSDGTSYTVSEYLYTTCSGCNPDQECDDPNDPYEGAGGGPSPTFPPNPADGDETSVSHPNGKFEIYRFNAQTNSWQPIYVVLPPHEITSSNNSFLNVQWPFHGQSILSPNNLTYVYDANSGNWIGAPPFIIDGPTLADIIANIADYLKCFSLNAAAKVTIYVDQPTVNSRSTWSGSATNPDVGHTFVSVQQGGITRVFGFYPSDGVNPIFPSTTSVLVDDSGHHYDVAIEINVTAAQLASVINAATNFAGVYNLNSYNCTDFGINIAAAAGVSLPDSYGSWPRGGGSNPGDMGQDIRSMSAPSGSTKNTSGGTGPSNSGSCN